LLLIQFIIWYFFLIIIHFILFLPSLHYFLFGVILRAHFLSHRFLHFHFIFTLIIILISNLYIFLFNRSNHYLSFHLHQFLLLQRYDVLHAHCLSVLVFNQLLTVIPCLMESSSVRTDVRYVWCFHLSYNLHLWIIVVHFPKYILWMLRPIQLPHTLVNLVNGVLFLLLLFLRLEWIDSVSL
jgi:hypothetical protein